jgi:hypothetical protein
MVFGSTEPSLNLSSPSILESSVTRSSSLCPELLSYSPILTPVKIISLKPFFISFFASATASSIEIVLLLPLAKGMMQKEQI